MRKGHSNNIPKSIEYIGLGQWSVRWNIQEDTNSFINENDYHEEDVVHYVYDEEIYDEEPTYGLFVTNRIRDAYSADEENALKSNMIESILNNSEIDESLLVEWQAFQNIREDAKRLGRELFKVD